MRDLIRRNIKKIENGYIGSEKIISDLAKFQHRFHPDIVVLLRSFVKKSAENTNEEI